MRIQPSLPQKQNRQKQPVDCCVKTIQHLKNTCSCNTEHFPLVLVTQWWKSRREPVLIGPIWQALGTGADDGYMLSRQFKQDKRASCDKWCLSCRGAELVETSFLSGVQEISPWGIYSFIRGVCSKCQKEVSMGRGGNPTLGVGEGP